MATQTYRIRQPDCHVMATCDTRHIIQITIFVPLFEIHRRVDDAVFDAQRSDDEFDRTSGTHHMAEHRFG